MIEETWMFSGNGDKARCRELDDMSGLATAAFRQRGGNPSPLLSWPETAACVIVFFFLNFFFLRVSTLPWSGDV